MSITYTILYMQYITWVFELVCHGAEGGHLLLLGGVDDHHGGAQDAQQAADLAVHIQTLVQEVGGQHSTVGYTEDITKRVAHPRTSVTQVLDQTGDNGKELIKVCNTVPCSQKV